MHKVGQQVGTKQPACALAQSGGERPCAVGLPSKKLGKSGDGIQSELGKLGSAWSATGKLGMHSLVYRRAQICAISDGTR